MKNFYLLLLLFSGIVYSQSINGVYKSTFTSFTSKDNPSKNFRKPIDDIITVEIYDAPYTRGYVSITSKDSNGDSATFKFVVKTEKKYEYIDGETYLCYDGIISLLEVETKTQCTIAFDVKLEALIIAFNGGGTQAWKLQKI